MGDNKPGDDAKVYAAGFAAGLATTTAESRNNKANDDSKRYGMGYSAGFAAGIAAGLAATREVDLSHFGQTSNASASTTNTDKVCESSEAFSPAAEEDFSHLDSVGNTREHTPDVSWASEGNKEFSVVTGEDLDHLVPGCFVQVGSGATSYWVEIGQIDGTTISGIVHPELSGTLCVINHDSCEIARFSRDQITALGCDRYCWC